MYSNRYIPYLVFVLGFSFFGCTDKDHKEHKASTYLNQVNPYGARTGPWEIFSDSVLIERGSYVNGKKDGLWTTWYPNGQMKEEGHYNQGIKHGMWVEWYVDGEIMWKGEWENGTRHIQGRGARVDILFLGQEHFPAVLSKDTVYLIRIRIQNIPASNLFIELSSGEISQEDGTDSFILKTSSDTSMTMAVGYMPDLQFRDFRNLVSEQDFTLK